MHRYTDSDSDGDARDSNLDMKLGSNYQSVMGGPRIAANSQYDTTFNFSDDDDMDINLPQQTSTPPKKTDPNKISPMKASYGDDTSSPFSPTQRTAYDPDEDLLDGAAASEMASLFSLITKFQPEPVELNVHWKPFIPDLVPAIGAIDAFIKIPRPDGELDSLGLVIVDEPSIAQSNPQVLRMELREEYGISSPGNEGDAYVGMIEDAPKNRKALDSWLESIEDIHRKRPPPVMMYSRPMPEMEELMEPFSPKFEETLNALVLPSCEIDLSFDDYARVVCALLDIPVSNNLVESLHHLFSLYVSFSGNTYFQSIVPSS